MKIKVIGCGNAFSYENGNQSFLLEENDRTMLIDVGARIPPILHEMKIPLSSIDDIYISHQHADHIGGLEEVAFTRYDWMNKPQHYSDFKNVVPPRLICNESLMEDLWNESLKGGLKSMEGFDSNIETFFEPLRVPSDGKFHWEGWDVSLIQQIHVMTGNRIMLTYGLFFEREGRKTVYFTIDSQHCSPRQIEIFYKKADIIFQDCETVGVDMSYPDGKQVYKNSDGEIVPWPEDNGQAIMELMAEGFEPFPFSRFNFTSGVHASYSQLAGYDSSNSIKLSSEIKKKMWLSHYQDFVNHNKDYKGNSIDWHKEAEKDGFAGFLNPGMEFEV